jgi:hypothetical protein
MFAHATVLLIAAFAVTSAHDQRAPDMNECPPEVVEALEAGAPPLIIRRSELPTSAAPTGTTALSLGPDVLIPVPDSPLRSMLVAPIKGNVGIIVLNFDGEPVQRVTINLGMHANLAELAVPFGVSPGEMILHFLESTAAPPCSDRAAFVYHHSADLALRLVGLIGSDEAVLHWADGPLRVSFSPGNSESKRDRTALYEITVPDRRVVVVAWAKDTLPGLELTELITGDWLARPASPPELDAIAASIKVGTYDAVLSAAADLGVSCRTRYEDAHMDCTTAVALLKQKASSAADASPSSAKD